MLEYRVCWDWSDAPEDDWKFKLEIKLRKQRMQENACFARVFGQHTESVEPALFARVYSFEHKGIVGLVFANCFLFRKIWNFHILTMRGKNFHFETIRWRASDRDYPVETIQRMLSVHRFSSLCLKNLYAEVVCSVCPSLSIFIRLMDNQIGSQSID